MRTNKYHCKLWLEESVLDSSNSTEDEILDKIADLANQIHEDGLDYLTISSPGSLLKASFFCNEIDHWIEVTSKLAKLGLKVRNIEIKTVE